MKVRREAQAAKDAEEGGESKLAAQTDSGPSDILAAEEDDDVIF